ncbi:monooxygenase [Hypoxylon crocopeplum]|nr:monooxygenase [Hypoxylon crocopeplum]
MSKSYDVIIAGAGPIGLFLACELGTAGASVLVLERNLELDAPWKVEPLGRRGINTVSIEALYRRGLLDQVVEHNVNRLGSIVKTPGFQFAGHFAGMLLNANKLDMTRWKYRLPGPALQPGGSTMARIEAALTERAKTLDVTILRGKGVTKVSQDDDGVTAEAEDETFRAQWLVGCDGGRSTVRKAAGFEFVGTEPEFTGYAIMADLDHPERLERGFNLSKGGMYIFVFGGSFFLLDFDGAAFDRKQEITKEHIQDVMDRVTGIDVKITKLHHVSSFTDRSMQAKTYRKGRVLLAGDAAHIHSPLGAQGLNLGLGDAMNLGWKLGATVRAAKSGAGPVDLTLLDTYEKERHAIAAWVLEWTRAQVLTLKPDLFGAAIRKLVQDLIDTTDGTNLFIDRVWGLSQRYDLGGEHPLVGSSVPDFELLDGSRLGPKLERARGALVDFSDDADLKELATKYEAKVDYIGGGAKDQLGLRALLVRPDGIVAWIAEEKPDVEAAKAALERWFGLAS